MHQPSAEERLRAALEGSYEVRRPIAVGGMATVYLADDLKHGRKVAIKVLDSEVAAAIGPERFLREIAVVARLSHPHILPLFDSGEAEGFLYFVMPFAKGQSLRTRLDAEGQLPLEEATRFTREIAGALEYAHKEGVVHRDVKPGNVMLENEHALLADFGVAHALSQASDERLTGTGSSLGTPAYMSPEQISGERTLDGRSDQYALGCVLYEMVAGQPPFAGSGQSVAHQHLAAQPRPMSDLRPRVPQALHEVVDRALAKAPADRFDSMADFRRAVAEAMQTAGAVAPRTKSRTKALPYAFATLGLAAVLVAGAALLRPEAGPPISQTWMFPADFTGSAEAENLRAARDLVIAELEQAPNIAMITPAGVSRALELAGHSGVPEVGRELALELAEREGVDAVLSGELDRLGDSYAIRLRVLEVDAEGEPVAIATQSASGPDELVEALGQAARDLRIQLGEAELDLARDPVLLQVMTPSLPAYRKYTEALSGWELTPSERIDLFQEALQLDTGFATAMMSATNQYANTGQYDSGRIYLDRALARPERLTEAQRIIGRAMAASTRGDIPEAYRLQRQGAEMRGAHHTNVGIYLDRLGRSEEAADYFRTLDKPFGLDWAELGNQVGRLTTLGHLEEAESLMETRTQDWSLWEFNILVARGQWGEALAQSRQRANDVMLSPGFRARWTQNLASVLAARGAVAESRQALEATIRSEPGYGVERYVEGSLLLLSLVTESPMPTSAGTLDADSSTAGLLFQGFAAALRGDSMAARAFNQPIRQGPTDSYAPYASAFPMTEGAIAYGRGDWAQVTELLAEAAPGYWPHFPRGNLLNQRLLQWMVGNAYEKLSAPDSAAKYFEMMLQPGPDFIRAGLAMTFARRRLALLYDSAGKNALAEEQWQAFLDAFTTPDPEFVWMVEEAREALPLAR